MTARRKQAGDRGRTETLRIGLVSDTHDKVLAALHHALAGVDEILHAGDVASAAALAEIETIAPVTAVRGNMDERALADRLAEEEILTRGGVRIALVHGHRVGRASVDDLAKRFEGRGVDLVVWGHIHEPVSELRDGVRYFNPGTAGGIGAPATCGILTIPEHDFTVEHILLGVNLTRGCSAREHRSYSSMFTRADCRVASLSSSSYTRICEGKSSAIGRNVPVHRELQ